MYDNYDDYTTMSMDKLCENLDISRKQATVLLKTGQVEGFKIGSVWKIPLISYKEYVDRSRKFIREHYNE